jgi:hypothetical protein
LFSFALASPLSLRYSLAALRVEVRGSLTIADSSQQSAFSRIGNRLNKKKGLRQAFDRPFELHFGLCLQQNVYGGGGLAEGRRQRAANAPLPNHPGRKEIVHPVLLVALLAEMGRELGPVPDAVQQRMNKDLAAAGGELAG